MPVFSLLIISFSFLTRRATIIVQTYLIWIQVECIQYIHGISCVHSDKKKRKKGKKRQMRDMSDYIFLFNFASVMLSIGGCYISHTFVPCSIWIHRFSNCQPYYLHLCTMGTHFFSLSLSTFSKESATTTKKSSAILLFWSVCFVHVPLHPFRPIVRSIYTLCTPFQS